MARLIPLLTTEQAKGLLQALKDVEPKTKWERGKMFDIPNIKTNSIGLYFDAILTKYFKCNYQVSVMIIDKSVDFTKYQFPSGPSSVDGNDVLYLVVGEPLYLSEIGRLTNREKDTMLLNSGSAVSIRTIDESCICISSRMKKEELSPNWTTYLFRITQTTHPSEQELLETLAGYERTIEHMQMIVDILRSKLATK